MSLKRNMTSSGSPEAVCMQASVPIGFVEAFLPAGGACSPFAEAVPAARSAAVQLLIAYMGATLGSLAAVRAFVQQAVDCYRCANAHSRGVAVAAK